MKKIKKFSIVLVLLLLLFIIPGCNSSISITTKLLEKDMFVGDMMVLEVETKDTTETNIIWTSDNEKVCIVSEIGAVKALNPGDATITATVGELESKVLIHVFNKDEKEEISVDITGPQSVLINESISLTSKITPESFKQEVKWTTSDKTIATVNDHGLVKGIKPGVVTIKATSVYDATAYKEITIIVRTGDGIQDVIKNYIENNTYITEGKFDITSVNDTVVNLVKNVEKSVIGVLNKAIVDGKEGTFTGTAGIYKQEKTDKGYKYTAFTNHHVVEGAIELKVYLGDIDEFVPATVIKSDENMDIAVITFEHTNNYTPLTLGSVGDIKKGDFVVAIGNPGGFEYYGSVTFGMVSCPNRLFKDRNMIYVQHDAPINPGNSGGPLFNLDGKVIGINTLKFAASDIEGMGFSIAMEKFLDYLK